MPRRDVRAEILEAAEALAMEKGFIGVTTKEVARAASCSEGSIYNHFSDRADLLSQVVADRMLVVVGELSASGLHIGADGSLRGFISAVAGAYARLITLSTSLFADPEVVARFNAVLEQRDASPDGIRAAVTEHLLRAQADGVVRSDVDPEAIALLVTGTCHEVAMHGHLRGHGSGVPDAAVAAIADTFEVLLRPTA